MLNGRERNDCRTGNDIDRHSLSPWLWWWAGFLIGKKSSKCWVQGFSLASKTLDGEYLMQHAHILARIHPYVVKTQQQERHCLCWRNVYYLSISWSNFFLYFSGAAYKNEWIWSKYNQFLLSYSIELLQSDFLLLLR